MRQPDSVSPLCSKLLHATKASDAGSPWLPLDALGAARFSTSNTDESLDQHALSLPPTCYAAETRLIPQRPRVGQGGPWLRLHTADGRPKRAGSMPIPEKGSLFGHVPRSRESGPIDDAVFATALRLDTLLDACASGTKPD